MVDSTIRSECPDSNENGESAAAAFDGQVVI